MSISDAKGKGRARASPAMAALTNAANGSASKSKSHKAKPKPANGTDLPSTVPSVRSERLKNKRAKMEAESPSVGPPGESLQGSPDTGGMVVDSSGDSNGMNISVVTSKKPKSKSSKLAASKTASGSHKSVVQAPAMSTTSTPTPSEGTGSGYKIKIRPRQLSNQTIPLAQSASVENVLNSPAYASLYTPRSMTSTPVNGEDQPSPNKRPRLALHSGPPPPSSLSHTISNGANSHPNLTQPLILEPSSVSSSSHKPSSKPSSSSRKHAPRKLLPYTVDSGSSGTVPGASEPPLWTRVPLPPPPTASPNGGSAECAEAHEHLRGHHSRSGSVGSPGVNVNGMGSPSDFRSALSPSAGIPGRTIYSHSQS